MATTVDGYALDEAQTALADWKAAITGLASSQSYTIGTRTLTRVDLATARGMVVYFAGIVEKFQAGLGGAIPVFRVIPRDL